MNIIIPEDYQNAVSKLQCFRLLQEHNVTVFNDAVSDEAALAKRFKDADVLVMIRERTPITAGLLDRLPRLKLISQTGKIASHIDLAACSQHKVAVAEGSGSPTAPAELAWSLILNARRQLPQAIAAMKEGRWQTNIGQVLEGQLLGIWGYGKIGKKVAHYAKAFGMRVIVWGSLTSRTAAITDGFESAENKMDFFRLADVISLHLRLVPETTGSVTALDLATMKSTAIIVNISRAELIQEGALENALGMGNPGFAAVDVYENEPVYDVNYPLLQLPNVICTPHLGYVEQQSYELYFGKAFENILAYANGTPTAIVNPEIL
ncbi:D-2-hydroxyacid dehydrogenase family protein [Flavobacterium kingsejongi]|uniref:3-phosphoglycerate dehydrogenase n=1 Tax=Flavobacterium kingsejongi TaxID=1678728 RepID=A0A2S1LR86_9FLAO|nr:D-2-hydroxyacid dehydrogenase family protein [Flavobacterium kingsejongi]AWG26239.1 3-phosphoglycerate dehydrogenase [Flavobacterium kingsejongi]